MAEGPTERVAPACAIGAAVLVGRIATGEAEAPNLVTGLLWGSAIRALTLLGRVRQA